MWLWGRQDFALLLIGSVANRERAVGDTSSSTQAGSPCSWALLSLSVVINCAPEKFQRCLAYSLLSFTIVYTLHLSPLTLIYANMLALLALLAAGASAQIPPPSSGLTVVQSKFRPGVTISYKQVGRHTRPTMCKPNTL